MSDLRRELELLAVEIEYPATPDLAASTRRVLDQPSPPRRRISLVPGRRVVLLAALFVLLAAGTVFAAVPGVRHAVLEFFHVRGATVERVSTLPGVTPTPPAFGGRVTLAEAQSRVGFHVLVPARYGHPRAVFVRSALPGGEVSLEYRKPRRLLVSEFRGDTDPDYVGKIAGQATRVQRLTVDGRRAIWIAGAPHFFFYRSPDGTQRFETLRLAGNVLLLERGLLLVRLEGSFGRDEAVAIASSLR